MTALKDSDEFSRLDPADFKEPVSHYYGDIVRQLFVSTAAVMLIGLPFYGSQFIIELPFAIGGALALVALAALANPHSKTVFVLGAALSGAGLVLFELWALLSYQESTWPQFVLREVIALLFLAGFYFTMKTVRAFILHKVGKHDEAGEFE